MKWKEIEFKGFQPIFRHGHRVVCNSVTETLYFYGGGDRKICNELTGYSIKKNIHFLTMVNNKGKVASNLAAASFGMVIYDNKIIIIFGGMKEYGHYSNELHSLNLQQWSWKKHSNSSEHIPCPRFGHSFTLTDDKRIILFGGLTNANKIPLKANTPKYMKDLYVLHIIDDEKFKWEKLPVSDVGPCARESHTACFHFDAKENRKFLIIFGGMNGDRLGDLWFLDLTQMIWTQYEISGLPPTPRSLHTATMIGTKMYIFGGWVDRIPKRPMHHLPAERFETTNLLSYLDLEQMQWGHFENYNEACPAARAGHSMVAHDTRLYLFSGRANHKIDCRDYECLQDFWYLETQLPSKVTNISLVRATKYALEIKWDEVSNAECYLVEIHKIQAAQIDLSKIRIKGGVAISGSIKDDKKEGENNGPLKRKLEELSISNNEKKFIMDANEVIVTDENQNEIKIGLIETVNAPENLETSNSPQKTEKVNPQNTIKMVLPTVVKADSQKSWLTVGIFRTNSCVVDGFYPLKINTKDLNYNNCPHQKQLEHKIQLSPKTMFAFRVAAINLLGTSDWSKMSYFETTLEDIPSSPSNCKFIPTQNGLRMAWTPNILTDKVTRYSVYIAGNKLKDTNELVFLRVYEGREPTAQIDKMTIKAAYREKSGTKEFVTFQIMASNNHGESKPSTVTYFV